MTHDARTIGAIRKAAERFLDLLKRDAADPSSIESELAIALDHLAWAVREIPRDIVPEFSVEWPAVTDPSIPLKTRKSFPRLGSYWFTEPAEPSDKPPDHLVRDAIDDISDIAQELLEALDVWDRTGEAAGLWTLHSGFESHWEYHLRGLQYYLFHRLSALGEAACTSE